MIVAGTYLTDDDIAALADKLRAGGLGESADRLENAYQRDARMLSLSTEERDEFLDALSDCPTELLRFRAMLQEQQQLV